jgi:hypothetical protein
MWASVPPHVILSAAKDPGLITLGTGILRCAQDDTKVRKKYLGEGAATLVNAP